MHSRSQRNRVAEPARVAALIRRTIAEIEFERACIPELVDAVDDYRDLLINRMLALGVMLGRLRRQARRHEWLAEHRAQPEPEVRRVA